MPEFIRTFVAIPVIPSREIKRILVELAELKGPLRVLNHEDVHLTLAFLGDTPINRTHEVSEVLRETLCTHNLFDVNVVGLGAFPDRKRPRVVWAGLDPQEPLRKLANDISSRLAALGFPKEERRYSPHLTLARVKGRPPEQLFAFFDELGDAKFGEIRVDRVVYYQSELLEKGPKYTPLAEFELCIDDHFEHD